LEDVLKSKGANFTKTQAWGEKVVVDGQVITGQNPASAHAVGEALLKAIGEFLYTQSSLSVFRLTGPNRRLEPISSKA